MNIEVNIFATIRRVFLLNIYLSDPAIERRRSSEVLQTTRNLPADSDNILPTVNKKINGNIGDIG